MKSLIHLNKKKIIYFFILFFFSILINQYYGSIGVFPLDSFLFFDSGYRALNGFFAFKDYWAPTGPLLDIIQAFLFKIFGVSWFSYVLHASIFNFLITIATFYTLNKFKLNISLCLFYSLLVSIIAYPVSGTPFIDHHSSIFSLLSLFSFILAIKTREKFYWFLTPIFLVLAFLSKQTPAGYIALIIITLSIIYFIFYFDLSRILSMLLGLFFILIMFLIFLKVNEINFLSFYEQYILFPLNIGEGRVENFLFPLEFNRIILRYKLIYISQLTFIIIIIKQLIKNYKYLLSTDFFIQISIILTSFSFIFHQILTFNQKFIFFIIPIFLGFSHIYYVKYFHERKYVVYLIILLSLASTIYYKHSYVDNRKFMELENVNLENFVDASIIDKKLNNLKWINYSYPDDPMKEINYLKDAINFIKNDDKNKMIITEYQFISSLMQDYIHVPSRTYNSGADHPIVNSKYFDNYKNFFIDKIIKNNIEVIYIIKPLNHSVYDSIIEDRCIKKSKINEILYSHLILKCEFQ
tara:strand:- start:70 stop:1638 length:1569 start_codon:yes stop_codon:yes gene_type:complete